MIEVTTTVTSIIELPSRVRVLGAVLSFDALPLPLVSVAINFTGTTGNFPSPGATVTTDEFGQYEAWLDPGNYLFQTSPAYGNSYRSAPTAYLFENVPAVEEWQLKPLIVSRGDRQIGRVQAENAPPIADAMVVPYLKHENTIIQLQNVTTDALGNFSIVVPSVY